MAKNSQTNGSAQPEETPEERTRRIHGTPEEVAKHLDWSRNEHRRREREERERKQPAKAEPKPLDVRWGNEMVSDSHEFIWPGWIPKGELTILAGRHGTGKGLLLCRFAAAATGTAHWPCGTLLTQGGKILWVGDEDSPEKTVRNRMEAAGMDLSRYGYVLPPDKGDFARHMLHSELPPRTRLIVVDPLIGGMVSDSDKATDSRRVAQAWVDVARHHNVAVVGVMHFSKWTRRKVEDTGDLCDVISGSHQWVAAARSVMLYMRDRDVTADRLLISVKRNYDEAPDDDAYHVASNRTEWDAVRVSGFRPEPHGVDCARELLSPKTAQAEQRETKEAALVRFVVQSGGRVSAKELAAWMDDLDFGSNTTRSKYRLRLLSKSKGEYQGELSYTLNEKGVETLDGLDR
ncbi:MAG: AAA family ATPase [Gammaproteobacteria bacterium]|nr:AAA family ATPase [Gammaproteobacteria bacterium]